MDLHSGGTGLSGLLIGRNGHLISACPATEVEAKTIREVLSLAQPKTPDDSVEEVLEKHELIYALRVVAWVTRFITNCKTPKKLTGPLSAHDLENAK